MRSFTLAMPWLWTRRSGGHAGARRCWHLHALRPPCPQLVGIPRAQADWGWPTGQVLCSLRQIHAWQGQRHACMHPWWTDSVGRAPSTCPPRPRLLAAGRTPPAPAWRQAAACSTSCSGSWPGMGARRADCTPDAAVPAAGCQQPLGHTLAATTGLAGRAGATAQHGLPAHAAAAHMAQQQRSHRRVRMRSMHGCCPRRAARERPLSALMRRTRRRWAS